MRVLVTGADGFVGSWLVPRLLEDGHAVVAAIRRGTQLRPMTEDHVEAVELELEDAASVARMLETRPDAVVHLAAMASGSDARRDPEQAWRVNAVGTAMLAEGLSRMGRLAARPRLLLVSTAEVYGRGPHTPRVESDPTLPVSPYAASKLAAEIAALEVARRAELPVVVARAFPHSGRGQDERFVIPALARRILLARRAKAPVVKVGNLEPVREFMHVADVVDAYARLVVKGRAGEVYNVACGRGFALAEVLERLMQLAGYRVIAETDPELVRPADIPYLVGDGAKLRTETGWAPQGSFEELLAEVLNAQKN